MNCREFHDLMQRRLDGESPAADGCAEHLRACPACAALDAAARCLVEGLRRTKSPAPPADLSRRIVARALRGRALRPRRRRRVVVPLTLAACLLLAVGVRLCWPRPVPDVPSASLLPRPEVVEDRRTNPGPAAPRDTVASRPVRPAGQELGSTQWLLPDLNSAQVYPQQLEPPARTLRQAGAGVRAGLEPVTGSARRAVGLFLRELPVDLGDNEGW
jgi:hypothetical protein